MNDKGIRLFRLIYSIVVSAMIVVSGLLLMAACLQIYYSGGEQIYTPEKVAAAFAPIALPIYVTLSLIISNFFLAFFLPVQKKRLPVQKQYAFLLRRAYEKTDMLLCEPDLLQKITREQKRRHLALWLCFAAWLIGGICFLPQACNSSNYSQELVLATDSIVAIIGLLIPCTLIPIGCSIFCAYYCRASLRRELALVNLVPKAAVSLPQVAQSEKMLHTVRLAVLTLALAMIIFGYATGGTADVLAKAVAICTECVGLG